MHNNPFRGKEDALHGDGTNKNPYTEQTEKWAMYNKGSAVRRKPE